MNIKKRTLPPGEMACAPKNTTNDMKQIEPKPIAGSRTYAPKPGHGLSAIKGAVNQPYGSKGGGKKGY